MRPLKSYEKETNSKLFMNIMYTDYYRNLQNQYIELAHQ